MLLEGGAKTRLAYVVGSILLAGALVLGCARSAGRAEDEDRPPIIVRGGSLIFQSGEDESKPGKPWFEDATGEWKQIHDAGKPTNVFKLTFDSASGCGGQHTPDFVVGFDPDGAGSSPEVQFTVSGKPRGAGGQGTPGPAVEGKDLDNSNKRPTPRLVYAASSGGVIRVLKRNGQVICGNVGQLRADPLQ